MYDLLVAVIYEDRPTAIERYRNDPGVLHCILFDAKRVAYPTQSPEDSSEPDGVYAVEKTS